MNSIDEYAEFTDIPWTPVADSDKELAICAIGLSEEAGEVAGIIKKYLHYDRPIDLTKIEKELGDVAFYWARLCKLMGLFPSNVLTTNEDKLYARMERGTIKGEGSDR